MFGAILLAVVAVAVTAVLSPLGPVGAAIGGNVASQVVGLATGIQSKFDWAGLALTAVTAGLTQGLSEARVGGQSAFGSLGIGGDGILATAARGALVNAATQGIGVATGLQSRFDWAGVAAAGIGAGLGRAVGGAFNAPTSPVAQLGQALVANTAGGIANAATRSLVNGTDFGDNVIAALPDIIGQPLAGSWPIA